MRLHRNVIPVLLLALVAGPAVAGSAIEVAHPWARPTIPDRPGAVYFGVHNLGDAPDRLVAARAEGVGAIELHRSAEKDGVMTMEQVESVDIPAGGMADFGPGGLHLMLFDIESPLEAGETLSLTLEFEQAGEVAVEVSVTRDAPAHHGGGDHQHDGGHDHGGSGN